MKYLLFYFFKFLLSSSFENVLKKDYYWHWREPVLFTSIYSLTFLFCHLFLCTKIRALLNVYFNTAYFYPIFKFFVLECQHFICKLMTLVFQESFTTPRMSGRRNVTLSWRFLRRLDSKGFRYFFVFRNNF